MNPDDTLLRDLISNLSCLKTTMIDADGLPFCMHEHVWVKRGHVFVEFILVSVVDRLVGLSDLHSAIWLNPTDVIRKSPYARFKAPDLIPPNRLVWVKSAAEGGNDFTYVAGRLSIRTGKLWFQPMDFQKVFDEARWVSRHDTISTSPVNLSQLEHGLRWTVDVVREKVTVVSTIGDGPIEFLGSFDDFLVSKLAKKLSECAAVVAYF
jgi:hypothetical protein